MVKINELNEFEDMDISSELKEFLIRKFSDILKEYNLSGMGGMFSVILLCLYLHRIKSSLHVRSVSAM